MFSMASNVSGQDQFVHQRNDGIAIQEVYMLNRQCNAVTVSYIISLET